MFIIRTTNLSSQALGPCECCGKHVSEVYHLTQSKTFKDAKGATKTTYLNCIDKFGHEKCLKQIKE